MNAQYADTMMVLEGFGFCNLVCHYFSRISRTEACTTNGFGSFHSGALPIADAVGAWEAEVTKREARVHPRSSALQRQPFLL